MQSKQKKKGILKLLAKSTIVLTLAVSLALPYGFKTRTKAAETKQDKVENVAETSSVDEVLSLDSTKPSEYDKYSEIDVYGNKKTPFLISEQNELFLYNIKNSNKNKTLESKGVWYNNIDMTLQSATKDYNFVKSINKKNSGANNVNLTKSTYSFVQGIGFDPLGHGTKDYAGFVGYNYTDGYLYCFVTNPLNGNEMSVKLNSMNWYKNKNEAYYVMPNVMSITAGDYNGDHHDTLLVYGCGDGGDQKIYEISFDGNQLIANAIFDVTKVAPNTLYKEKGKNDIKYKLQLTLTTGDFDGDGIEEYAFTVGNGNTSNSAKSGYTKTNGNIENFVTKVCINDFNGKTWSNVASFSMYDKNGKAKKIEKVNDKTYKETYNLRLMQGGSLTSADTNGDGVDEIIVAGYTSYDDIAEARFKVEDKGNTRKYTCEWINNIGDLDKKNFVVSVINSAQGSNNKTVYQRTELENLQMESFTQASIAKSQDSDYVFPHITMASGKTNGKNQPEDVFIDGSLYSFESDSAQKLYTPKLMTQHFDTVLDQGSSNKTSVYWINNVAVGNFDHNDAGREQFVYTVWFKQHGKDEYYAFLGVEGGCKYGDEKDASGKIKSFGTCSEYGGNDIRAHYKNVVWSNESSACQVLWKDYGTVGANAVPVAVDTKKDGVLAKYNSAYYEYSDPEVIAVLQAPPQFTECQDEGSISYTISNGFGRSKSEGWEISFNVGFAGEFGFDVGVKVGVEAGVNNSFSKTYTNAYSIAESATITSAGDTSVIVSRTPLMIYVYDVYNPSTKKWEEASYAVTVPLTPAYYSLSVEDYNDLVDKYNALVENYNSKKDDKEDTVPRYLSKIVRGIDLPSVDNDPFAYANEKISGMKKLTEASAAIDTNGGSKSLAWEREDSSEEDYTHTHGFYVSVTAQIGVSLFKESWLGINVGIETNWSFSLVKSTTSGISIEAEVPNLNKNALKEEGYSNKQINSYKFTWQLAKWSRYLNGTENDAVPFYGFIVKDVNALPAPVSDLDADMCTDEKTGDRYINLTWSGDTKYRSADSYDVYRIIGEGKNITKKKLATVTDTSYIFRDLDDTLTYSFVVVSKKDDIKSFESNVAKASLTDKLIYDIRLSDKTNGKSTYAVYYIDGTKEDRIEVLDGTNGINGTDGSSGSSGVNGKDGKSAYDLAKEKGYNGTEDEWLASLKGADGKEGMSAYEIAVKNGYTGTETEWLDSLKGEDGTVATKGEDGKSAYDIAVTNGYAGTEAQWLESLKGEKGADGINGTNGTNGKSAYEIALDTGATTATDPSAWLASMKGVKSISLEDISLVGVVSKTFVIEISDGENSAKLYYAIYGPYEGGLVRIDYNGTPVFQPNDQN